MAFEKKCLIAIVGPSGSGKTAVIDFLASRYPDEFAVPRSVTSRPRRTGEGDGEYDFVTDEEFMAMADGSELLEHSRYAGHWYGLRKSDVQAVLDGGKFAVRAMDFPGAMASGAVRVFLDRDTDSLLDALLARNLPDADTVRRLRQIPEEKRNRAGCHHVVRNDGTIFDAASRIYALATGLPGRFVDGRLRSEWKGGGEMECPCVVNLASGQVSPSREPLSPDGRPPDEETLFLGPNGYPVDLSGNPPGDPDMFFRLPDPAQKP